MASGADSHTHIHLHRSDFKKPGKRWCMPDLKIYRYYYVYIINPLDSVADAGRSFLHIILSSFHTKFLTGFVPYCRKHFIT